jgi:hypothetical protein
MVVLAETLKGRNNENTDAILAKVDDFRVGSTASCYSGVRCNPELFLKEV